MIDEVYIFRRKCNTQLKVKLDFSTTEHSFTNHYCVDLRMTKELETISKSGI